MFVTQKSSAAHSDPERRQSKLCYRTGAARLICMVLVAALTVSSMIVPASAADPELLYQDILPADGYAKMIDGTWSESLSVSPTYFFQNANDVGWRWEARPYEHTFSSVIFTLYVNGNMNAENTAVYFSFYNGRRVKAELLGRVDTYYYQYRVDYSSNLSWVSIEAEFPGAFTGNFCIHSCIAVRDVGFKINTVDWSQTAVMIPYSTATLTNDLVKSETAATLPISHMSKRTDQYQNWMSDDIIVEGDFNGLSVLDSLTFLTEGFLCEVVTFSIISDNVEETKHIIEVENVGTKVSTHYPSWGDHAWDVYAQEITVDLSGYDLNDCRWELKFSVDPLSYNSTMSFTYWRLNDIVARLPVSETPWYKVFWTWVNTKWDSVSAKTNYYLNSILKAVNNIVVPSDVQEQLNDAAESMDNKTDQINDYNDRFQEVERPDVTGSDLLDPIIGHNQLGLAILTSFTSQEIVARLILAVFSFSLMGYVFFGKR